MIMHLIIFGQILEEPSHYLQVIQKDQIIRILQQRNIVGEMDVYQSLEQQERVLWLQDKLIMF